MGTAAYDKVTEAIIQRLEAGVIPWRCPWSSIMPRNIQGREYLDPSLSLCGHGMCDACYSRWCEDGQS